MEFETLFGLPAHPFLVHLPVVLVPATALGAVAVAARPAWRARFGVLIAVVAIVAVAGTWLASNSGGTLEEKVQETSLVERHEEMGDQLLAMVIVFALAVVALVVVDTWRRRRLAGSSGPDVPTARVAVAILSGLAVLSAVIATAGTVRAGHSGAQAVWEKDGPQLSGERE